MTDQDKKSPTEAELREALIAVYVRKAMIEFVTKNRDAIVDRATELLAARGITVSPEDVDLG